MCKPTRILHANKKTRQQERRQQDKERRRRREQRREQGLPSDSEEEVAATTNRPHTEAEECLLAWAEEAEMPAAARAAPCTAMVPYDAAAAAAVAARPYANFMGREILWDPTVKAELTRIPQGPASQEAKDEYARKQRSGYMPHEQIGRGNNPATIKALHASHMTTCICMQCGGLVDYQSARRNSRQTRDHDSELRDVLLPGDGCASPVCSPSFRPGYYADSQRKMAQGLASGKRSLIAWPKNSNVRELFSYPRELAILAARDGVAAAAAVDAGRKIPRRNT